MHPSLKNTPLVIATRESRLALWQAEHVQALLRQRGLSVELLGMTTKGDQILDRTLSKVGGKGLFVKELEVALEEGRAHIAVHSLKDVPMELPAGFALACVMEREDPRDAFVSPHYASLAQLPQGAVVGTSSLRRQVLLHALRPDLKIVPLRGNLDTRLGKVAAGELDAVVVARAGLARIDRLDVITETLDPVQVLPAPAQGALALECRVDDVELRAALAGLDDAGTRAAVVAERALLAELEAGCTAPVGALAEVVESLDDAGRIVDELSLRACAAALDGSDVIRASLVGAPSEAGALGAALARELLELGARELMGGSTDA